MVLPPVSRIWRRPVTTAPAKQVAGRSLRRLTLRAWKYAITNTVEAPPMDVYRMVAWWGWVPNIIVAEVLIRRYYFGLSCLERLLVPQGRSKIANRFISGKTSRLMPRVPSGTTDFSAELIVSKSVARVRGLWLFKLGTPGSGPGALCYRSRTRALKTG